MAASTTSFQKKSRPKVAQIPGTKPSLHKNQLLISTGVPSLDSCIGGGLAVGTVLLIEEDQYGTYSRLLLKYFLAEGVMNQHGLFVSGADTPAEELLQDLPAPIQDDPLAQGTSQSDSTTQTNPDMKIAWRYQHLPEFQSSPKGTSKFGHYYDLSKTMDPSLLKSVSTTMFDGHCILCEKGRTMNPSYLALLSQIKQCITEENYSTASDTTHRNILRIGIHSLGSPQWGENGGMQSDGATFDPSLCRFLLCLRSLMRTAYAACLITLPVHLMQSEAYVRRVESLCDCVVKLESFAGSDKETNPVFKDYHGLVKCIKLSSVNSLTTHMPDTLDLAFKLRRKKFTIERLHLPPELSDTASRAQEDPVLRHTTSSGGCGNLTGNTKLDF